MAGILASREGPPQEKGKELYLVSDYVNNRAFSVINRALKRDQSETLASSGMISLCQLPEETTLCIHLDEAGSISNYSMLIQRASILLPLFYAF
jgi:hypothetical protein